MDRLPITIDTDIVTRRQQLATSGVAAIGGALVIKGILNRDPGVVVGGVICSIGAVGVAIAEGTITINPITTENRGTGYWH